MTLVSYIAIASYIAEIAITLRQIKSIDACLICKQLFCVSCKIDTRRNCDTVTEKRRNSMSMPLPGRRINQSKHLMKDCFGVAAFMLIHSY